MNILKMDEEKGVIRLSELRSEREALVQVAEESIRALGGHSLKPEEIQASIGELRDQAEDSRL